MVTGRTKDTTALMNRVFTLVECCVLVGRVGLEGVLGFRVYRSGYPKPCTPLTQATQTVRCAAQHGHVEAVRLLLEAGADASLADNLGVTALIFASDQGHEEIMRTLSAAENRSEDTWLLRVSKP